MGGNEFRFGRFGFGLGRWDRGGGDGAEARHELAQPGEQGAGVGGVQASLIAPSLIAPSLIAPSLIARSLIAASPIAESGDPVGQPGDEAGHAVDEGEGVGLMGREQI